MTKLNWRDASKELPKKSKDYIVQVKYGDVHSDNFCMICGFSPERQKFFIEAQTSEDFETDYFYREVSLPILYWAEIPIPEE